MNTNHQLIKKNINLKEILNNSKDILYKSSHNKISIKTNLCSELKKIPEISYGTGDTPFGRIILAKTRKGICDLQFITDSQELFVKNLFLKYPKARFITDKSETKNLINKIFYYGHNSSEVDLHLIGTAFQLKIWQTLLKIPKGNLVSYQEIAKFVNNADASRAVGTAAGKNPIHYLVPCHRVIKSNGTLGGFKAGILKKQSLLESEL